MNLSLGGRSAMSCLAGLALLTGCDRSTPPAVSEMPPLDVPAVTARAEAGDVPAQVQLGKAFMKGQGGVTNSYKEASKWFLLAAEKGSADAQAALGELYEAGQGVPKDSANALDYYRMAATNGHAGAQYNLGFAYESGRGVAQDHNQAAKWFQMAAEGGDPLAQYDLGQRYLLGVGVTADKVEGLKWLMLAARQGQTDAATRIETVKTELHRKQIAEAERRAAQFQPRR